MWISSFVIALASPDESTHPVEDALRAIPVFTLGERIGGKLPVVLEAADGSSARYWHEWVEDLPGVVHVDVAFVSFEEAERSEETAHDEVAAGNLFETARGAVPHA